MTEYVYEMSDYHDPIREEIVRCMDCKYYDDYLTSCDWWGAYDRLAEPNGFCAWGERKGVEQ